MRKSKRTITLLAAAIAIGTLSGCSQSSNSASQAEAKTEVTAETNKEAEANAETEKDIAAEREAQTEPAVEKRKIVAATSASPNPFVYVDENGEVQGYEPTLLREVFKKLPQYELEFQVTEFASIFTGLDADLYQIGVNCLGYNTKRGEKYIFSDVLNVAPHGILVREDDEEIKTVYDFAGHKTVCSPTNANANSFERYNAAHPENPINIQYADTFSDYDSQVADGRIDFYYHTKINILKQINETGVPGLKVIDVPFEDSEFLSTGLEGNFVVFAKGEEELADDFNKAYEELLEEGTVAELQKEILDIDPETNILNLEYVEKAREFIKNDLKENGEQ